MSEHRRVLAARHGDVHDPRRHLHAALRLLQRQDRQADLERSARAGPGGAQRRPDGPAPRGDHLASTATTCPDYGAQRVRRRDPPDPPPGARLPRSRCSPRTSAGQEMPLAKVIAERPDVFNHNVEVVPRLYPVARRGSTCERSSRVLRNAKEIGGDEVITKSGLMVGLGETFEEMVDALGLLREHHVQVLTVGQYLRPTEHHLPIVRYWHPGRVHGARGGRLRARLRARRRRAAGALQLPRRPAHRPDRARRRSAGGTVGDEPSPAAVAPAAGGGGCGARPGARARGAGRAPAAARPASAAAGVAASAVVAAATFSFFSGLPDLPWRSSSRAARTRTRLFWCSLALAAAWWFMSREASRSAEQLGLGTRSTGGVARHRRETRASASAASNWPRPRRPTRIRSSSPTAVRGSRRTQLFTDIQPRMVGRRPYGRLRGLITPELLVEWERRLDDFERPRLAQRGRARRLTERGVHRDPAARSWRKRRPRPCRGTDRGQACAITWSTGAAATSSATGQFTPRDRCGCASTGRWNAVASIWVLASIDRAAEGEHSLKDRIVADPLGRRSVPLRDEALIEGAVAQQAPAGLQDRRAGRRAVLRATTPMLPHST